MDDGYWPLSFAALAAFIAADAALYGFGSAIQNLNAGALEKEAEEGGERAGRLLQLMEQPAEFINTVSVMTNLIGIVSGAYVLERFGRLFRAFSVGAASSHERLVYGVSLTVSGILVLAALISFGILIPKKCAAKNPERWSFGAFPIVRLFMMILRPFTALVSCISGLVLRAMGIDPDAGADNVTQEDIMLMVNEGHEQGILEAREAEMITNIFELNAKTAGDIMTHRTNVVALEADMLLEEAVAYILTEAGNSRFPVYEKDIDDIVGLLYLRDALVYAEQDENRARPIKELPGLLREAHFIPETRRIDTLFKEMQSRKIHMEIVVDEYGQTAGIATMEDILEEIVGNILDEYDKEEELIVKREDGSYLFDGLTPLEDVAEALEIGFSEEDRDNYDTLNGFLISRLDRIPKEDEQPEAAYGGYLFKAVSVENKMLHRVIAVLDKKEQEEENGEAAGQ